MERVFTSESSSVLMDSVIMEHSGLMPSSPLENLQDPSVPVQIQGFSASMSSASSHAIVPTGQAVVPFPFLQQFSSTGVAEGILTEEIFDSIDFSVEFPGLGRCKIYCARYAYDPMKQSPNANPDVELPLNVGDYIIIYGDINQVGFYNGQLLDGRKGLVPSNFVEKLTGSQLLALYKEYNTKTKPVHDFSNNSQASIHFFEFLRSKQKTKSKMENINECDDIPMDDMDKDTSNSQACEAQIIELSENPIIEFLSAIIDLSNLEKGNSSVLDDNENLLYILENLVLKMKAISQYHSTIAACVQLKESNNLEPDSFGYYVPKYCVEKDMEVYLSDKNNVLTQKLVCCLITAFKVILRMYDEKNDGGKSKPLSQQSDVPSESLKDDRFSEVDDLLCKFTKHALRAFTTFTYPNLKCCFNGEVFSNEVVAAENLAIMYVSGPLGRISNIYPAVFPVVFECIEKSSLVKVFTNFLLGHPRASKIISTGLFHYICHEASLEMLVHDETSLKKTNSILALFADVLQSFILFPSHIDQVHLRFLEIIVQRCIELIPVVLHPKHLIKILKTIFSAAFYKICDKMNFCDSLCIMLPFIFKAFNGWLQIPVECKTWIMILETVLCISNCVTKKSVLILLPYVETISKCIILCLKEKSELCLNALNIFQRILQDMTRSYINLSILPIKDDLLQAFFTTAKHPDKEISEKAVKILGNLGCYNRDDFKNTHNLLQNEKSHFHLFLLYEPHIPLESAFLLNMCSDFPVNELPLDVAYNIITNVDESVQRKKVCWSFIKEILKVQMDAAKMYILDVPTAKTVVKNPEFYVIHKTALIIMFVATKVECLSGDAKEFKKNVIETYIRCSSISEKSKKSHIFLLLLEAARETISSAIVDNKENIDITPFTSIIHMASLMYEKIYTYPIFQDVVKNVTELCYKENWEAKFAGCKIIRYILEITDDEWKINHTGKFFKHLLHSFADSNGKLSFGTLMEANEVLEHMLMSVSKYVAIYHSVPVNKLIYEIRDIMIGALVSANCHLRKKVRILLNKFKSEIKELADFSPEWLNESKYEWLNESTCVALLYEDFDFSCSLMHLLLRRTSKLYDDLKSLCDPSSFNYSITSRKSQIVNICCGALSALSLNFVDKNTLKELFEINVKALKSHLDQISETAFKCLMYIRDGPYNLADEINMMVDEWSISLSLHLSKPSLLTICEVKEILYFRKIYQMLPTENFSVLLLKLFKLFKYVFFTFIKFSKYAFELLPFFKKISLIIEIMNTVQNLDANIIHHVLLFITDLEPYKRIIPNLLKQALLKFCTVHHIQALGFYLNLKKKSFLFQELTVFQVDAYPFNECEEIILKKLNRSEVLQLLRYTSRCKPSWFKEKMPLIKYLHKFHKARIREDLPLCKSTIDTFLFLKESKTLVKCFTYSFTSMPHVLAILFSSLEFLANPSASNFQTLKDYILNTVAKKFDSSWFKNFFRGFREILTSKKINAVEAEIIEYIVIPSLFHSFKKGGCEQFFMPIENEVSVIQDFLYCMFKVEKEHYSTKVQHSFMKLAVMFAEQLAHKSYNKTYSISLKRFAVSCLKKRKFDAYSSLILAIFIVDSFDNEYRDKKKLETLEKCFQFLIESPEEAFVLERALYIFATELPSDMFCMICAKFITHLNKFLSRILNLILTCKKEFHTIAHLFLQHFMNSPFEDYEHIKEIIGLIDVVTYYKKLSEFDDTEIAWMVGILLKNLPSKEISDKCLSLFMRIMTESCFPIVAVDPVYVMSFRTWLSDHLKNIKNPDTNEKYEIFKLMSEVLVHRLDVVELFVEQLYFFFQNFFGSLLGKTSVLISLASIHTNNIIKIFESMAKFLQELVARCPRGSSKFEELYIYIEKMSTIDVIFHKAIILEAVGPTLYSTVMKKDIISHVRNAFILYLMKPSPPHGSKAVTVWLKILEKIFLDISETDRSNLLCFCFFSSIDRISHAEIILEIITVMNLFVDYLRSKMKITPMERRKKQKQLIFTTVYEVFAVLGKLSSKVDAHFKNNEEINVKLFEVLMKFREDYGSLLQQDHSFREAYFENQQQSSIRINEKLTSQYKTKVLYMPSGVNHLGCWQKFSEQLTKEMQEMNFKVFDIVKSMFENKFKISIPKHYIAFCISLVTVMVKRTLVLPECKTARVQVSPQFLSSLVQLCYEDTSLAEYIWMNLFSATSKMFGKEKLQTILNSNETKTYIKKISSNECSMIPNPYDVFINATLKANPEFCLNVDEKYIQRSLNFQVTASQYFENYFFLQEYSPNNDDEYIKILYKIYESSEESDLHYFFNERFSKHVPETVFARTKFSSKITETYKDLLDLMSKDSKEYSHSEKEFINNELQNCCRLLNEWDFFSRISASMSLRDIDVFPKWNFQDQLPTSELQKELMLQLTEQLMNFLKNAWKSLSRIFNRQHYSLLEFTQQITELTEVWNIQCSFQTGDMCETNKTFEHMYFKWKEKSYLFSDDYEFLTEIFHTRLALFTFLVSEYSAEENKILQDEIYRSACEKLSMFVNHEQNQAVIELCYIAFTYRNLHMGKKLQFDMYSYWNTVNVLKLELLYLLHDAESFSHLGEEAEKDFLKKETGEKIKCISDLSAKYLNRAEFEKIDIQTFNVFNKLNIGIKLNHFTNISHEIQRTKMCEIFYETFEPGDGIDTAVSLMKILLNSCSYGDALYSTKVIPKILHILEIDDKDRCLPEIFQESKIPVQYWLPFLPFLVDRLFRALNTEENNSRMEVDGDNKPSLISVLSNLLIEIGKYFPQEVFFSVYSFKEMELPSERSKFAAFRDEELYMHSCKEKCKKIIFSLKKIYPSLISCLEGFMKEFKSFSPHPLESDLCILKRLLGKTFSSLYENFETGNTKNCSTEFSSYIKKELEPYLTDASAKNFSNGVSDEILGNVESLSFVSVFDALFNLISNYRHKINVHFEKMSFLHSEHCCLSKYHLLDENINVFGQSPLTISSYQVKIVKILPKVEVQMWNDHFLFKINILGSNGKVYSFLMKEDMFQKEDLSKTKCIQMLQNLNVIFENNVECAKRFLNFYFLRNTPIGSHLSLVPYHHKALLYQDIFMVDVPTYLFLTKCLLENPEVFANPHEIVCVLQCAREKIHKNCLKKWVERLYPDHVDFYSFKKEFTKHISILIASEYFLNISMKSDLLVLKQSGAVTSFSPEFIMNCIPDFSFLLTPNIREFIGPLGIKQVIENVYWVASCFKENAKTIEAYLKLLIKNYEDYEGTMLDHFPEIVLQKLDNFKRENISKFVSDGSSADMLIQVNPLAQPFF